MTDKRKNPYDTEKKAPSTISPRAKPLNASRKRPRVYALESKISLTKQSFKDECDITNILNQYTKTGILTHRNPNTPQYGYAPANDFREALEIVRIANDSFMELPADIRRKFNNNPNEFLEFAQNPNNRAEMADMGLLDLPPTDVPNSHQEPVTGSTAPSEPNPDSISRNNSTNPPES
nr:MAG: internal scaffolding protein [Microvirus sp.]